MLFYLGTHQPGWLRRVAVPLFVSDRRLKSYVTLPRAVGRWALDSGGFTELSTYGSWAKGPTPAQYALRIDRYAEGCGNLDWAAPQDWMCEDPILAKTGLTIPQHQSLSTRSVVDLRGLVRSGTRIIPVVQGQEPWQYVEHVAMYLRAGIDLRTEPLVGVGSVCRRQGTVEARAIFEALHSAGVTQLHGFGLKKTGLALSHHLLASADSMAWSFNARRRPPMPGCVSHINCANCSRYALQWRDQLLQGY